MDKICVLVDFSPASKVAIEYACTIAEKAGATLQLLHVAPPSKEHEIDMVRKDLREFASDTDLCNAKSEIIVEPGDFQELIPDLLDKHASKLVIIATHGVRGIFHTMQGPEVLKLIQKVRIPSLVIQERTPRDFNGYESILLPISPHKNIRVKIEQTGAIAKIFNSKVLIYILTPPEGDLDPMLQQNLEKAEQTFDEMGVKYEEVYETSKVYGVGYAKQALEFVENRKIDLFAIMAHASEEHSYFGNVERSHFILNDTGIPVLCCNE
jgi:nucleotide-binding universal stress UspA family protein